MTFLWDASQSTQTAQSKLSILSLDLLETEHFLFKSVSPSYSLLALVAYPVLSRSPLKYYCKSLHPGASGLAVEPAAVGLHPSSAPASLVELGRSPTAAGSTARPLAPGWRDLQ